MNYFIISDNRNNIEEIKENYRPVKHFDLLDRDLTKEEFFVYVVDIMDEVYGENNVLVTTTNHKGTKKLFETVALAEIPDVCTVMISSNDDLEYLKATHIDNIIIKEQSDET